MVVLEASVTVQTPLAAGVFVTPAANVVLVMGTGAVGVATTMFACVTKTVGVSAVTVSVAGCSAMTVVVNK